MEDGKRELEECLETNTFILELLVCIQSVNDKSCLLLFYKHDNIRILKLL